MVSTLCAYAHDLLVLPSTYIAPSKEAEPYAFGFSVAVSAPGLRFICRPSVIHQNAASQMDYPLSSRFDETDAMVIFDDVLVPWERVFIHRDAELCNGLYNRVAPSHPVLSHARKPQIVSRPSPAPPRCVPPRTNPLQAIWVQTWVPVQRLKSLGVIPRAASA